MGMRSALKLGLSLMEKIDQLKVPKVREVKCGMNLEAEIVKFLLRLLLP
jgi:hypothetical protein